MLLQTVTSSTPVCEHPQGIACSMQKWKLRAGKDRMYPNTTLCIHSLPYKPLLFYTSVKLSVLTYVKTIIELSKNRIHTENNWS